VAFLKVSSPNRHPIAPIMHASGEAISDFSGAIATILGELVPKRIDAIRQISHERRRLFVLQPSELATVALARSSLACKLI